MKLKCHRCEAKNTVLVRKSCLERAVGGGPLVGAWGIVADPLMILATIAGVVAAIYAYLQYKLLRQSELVCLCRDCGYWERV
jgi:hypothetical protein